MADDDPYQVVRKKMQALIQTENVFVVANFRSIAATLGWAVSSKTKQSSVTFIEAAKDLRHFIQEQWPNGEQQEFEEDALHLVKFAEERHRAVLKEVEDQRQYQSHQQETKGRIK